MHIIERETSVQRLVHILPVEHADYKHLTTNRYLFKWNKFKNEYNIYKLMLVDSDDIFRVDLH